MHHPAAFKALGELVCVYFLVVIFSLSPGPLVILTALTFCFSQLTELFLSL